MSIRIIHTNLDLEFKKQNNLLYLPTQIRFPIGGERVTCHGPSLRKQRLELSACQLRQANTFYAVMAAKRFQTRTKEETASLRQKPQTC